MGNQQTGGQQPNRDRKVCYIYILIYDGLISC